jgi:hypothetical protein
VNALEAPAGSQHLTVRVETGDSCATLFDDAWDDLVRRQALPNPTLSATWLRHMVEWEEGMPVAIAVEQAGALVAAGAFGLYRPGGRFGPTLARWLGDHRQWCSPDLLVEPALPEAGAAVIDALLGLAGGVHLAAPADGPAASALAARVPWLTSLRGAEGWIAPLPAPRLKRMLLTDKRDQGKAARRGADVTSRVVSSPDEVLAALERLFVMHAARWRSLGGEIARFSTTERHRAWYRRVVGAMAERGEALISEVSEDGEVFGGDLGFLAGRGALAHTTSMRLGGKLNGPGRAVQLRLFFAFERAGAEAVDLGWGACDPSSPKAAVGPTRVLVRRFIAADSRRSQLALDTALALRDGMRRRRLTSLGKGRP